METGMIYDANEISEELLRELAQLAQSERSILSVYLSLEQGWEKAEHFIGQESKRLLPALEQQEKEYFETSLSLFYEYMKDKKQNGFKGPGIAFFVDLGADYMKGVELRMPPEPLLAVDKEALIHPLALQYDEYEPIGVIMIDAHCARVMIVAGRSIDDMDRFCKKIHHLSKVGGWSQMRYQRRRLKQIKHFSKDVVEKASTIFDEADVRRVLIAGRDRMIKALEDELGQNWKDRVVTKIRWDLDAADMDFLKKIRPIMEKAERDEEQELLQQLVNELRRGGLGVAGVNETRYALKMAQVDTLIISKALAFEVAEELTSLAKSTGAGVEFVPKENKLLASLGGAGALLRYKTKDRRTLI
jgi:peptide chain release factor subunit 1